MSGELLRPAIDSVRKAFGGSLSEVAILSTCNRTEFYCSGGLELADQLPDWLAEFKLLDSSQLKPHLYSLHQEEAVRHAFRVASGLDSMVLGEAQILGQMKTAVREAEQAGALGTNLHELFQKTFSVAKEVRTNTAIGEKSVSMAAAAVRLSERIFGKLANSEVLFIGAGQMIEHCTAHFAAAMPKSMYIANRSLDKGEELANRHHGNAMRLADLPSCIDKFDVVVSCTASTLPLIGMGMIKNALKKRRGRPMVLVDLAVPRDIEPEVAQLSDTYLYTVDDLGDFVQMGAQSRHAAVGEAEKIITERVDAFMHWLDTRSVVPVIKSLNQGARQLCDAEVRKAQKLLGRGEDPAIVLQSLAHALSQKYMHAPLSMLNKSAGQQRQQLLTLLPELFPYQEESCKH